MKAVGVSEFGGPEALRVFEVPEPHAGPGQVRVRVHAATVNPGDRYLRNGALGRTSPTPPMCPAWKQQGSWMRSGAAPAPTCASGTG